MCWSDAVCSQDKTRVGWERLSDSVREAGEASGTPERTKFIMSYVEQIPGFGGAWGDQQRARKAVRTFPAQCNPATNFEPWPPKKKV